MKRSATRQFWLKRKKIGLIGKIWRKKNLEPVRIRSADLKSRNRQLWPKQKDLNWPKKRP